MFHLPSLIATDNIYVLDVAHEQREDDWQSTAKFLCGVLRLGAHLQLPQTDSFKHGGGKNIHATFLFNK